MAGSRTNRRADLPALGTEGPRAPDLDPNDPAVISAIDEASWWSSQFGALLLDHVDMGPHRNVLDLGCGLGFPLLELAQRLGPTSRCYGADVWTGALQRAARKRNALGIHHAHLTRADGAALPFPNAAFDLIVSNVGVNNFARADEALRECGRVARPGASIALTTNPVGHMAEFYEAFRQTLHDLKLAERIPELDAQEAHRSTPTAIEGQLAAAGFRVTRVEERRLRLRYTDGTALFGHGLTRLGFLDGWLSALRADEAATVFPALEARLNAEAAANGPLRYDVPMVYLAATREAGPGPRSPR
ncbi:MAG: class I SAM-dependent methyltransferase [Gemmatimonadetes bacterium]|nr:class I SAM-dependent methyltransferase [Gemmatimonadota bacterium]